MKVSIRINGALNESRVSYLIDRDFRFLAEWRASLGKDKHPVRTDAMQFASLACKRFAAHSTVENYAQRDEDIADFVRNNPHCEVANLVVMKCGGFPESEVVGIAHFRRSWCNNLILDYLASHPWIASPPANYGIKVSGVGVGLLYFISNLAARYGCTAVWGEATQNSCKFYQKLFDLDSVQDLLYIPSERLEAFATSLSKKWSGRKP